MWGEQVNIKNEYWQWFFSIGSYIPVTVHQHWWLYPEKIG
jgi:hypothetical protein